MKGEDRLATLIRAQLDEDTAGVVAPPDLAARVIANAPARRRRMFGLQLAAVGCAVAMAALAFTPFMLKSTQQAPPSRPAAAFDVNAAVKVGYVPDGLVQDPRTAVSGFVTGTNPHRTRAGLEHWEAKYVSEDGASDRVNPHFTVVVIRSDKSFEWFQDTSEPSDWRPVEVVRGRAVGQQWEPGAGRSGGLYLWEARPGLYIELRAMAVAELEALKILRGITVTE
jgi:hypothetical protein